MADQQHHGLAEQSATQGLLLEIIKLSHDMHCFAHPVVAQDHQSRQAGFL